MTPSLRRFFLLGAATIGQPVVDSCLVVYDNAMVASRAFLGLPKALLDFDNVILRFDVLVLRCARLVLVASFAAGAVMAMQFGAGLGRFGATTYVPSVVANSIVEALGPMLAALMGAARSGGGLAAEIAAMCVTQQIDAIKALGSDPYQKLHAPNIFVLAIGLPLLTVVSDLGGLLGALFIEVTFLNLGFAQALSKTLNAIVPLSAACSVLKTVVAGALIGIIATREGIRVGKGTADIGIATTSAVVRTTIGVLVADLVMTKLLWAIL